MSTPVIASQLSVPGALRAIFARWAEPCDPALAACGAEPDPALYRSLASTPEPVPLSAAVLARIEHDAWYNAQFGEFAELRREGELILIWVRAILAPGPAPHDVFVPY